MNRKLSSRNHSDSTRLSSDEKRRYSRHLTIPEIGLSGQLRLKKARVGVVGAGGLGAPLLQYLAAAGVGTIGVIDDDIVEQSNLHRQVLFGQSDVGRVKVHVARERLNEINPEIEIHPINVKLDAGNVNELLEPYDIVADGTDNFAARYLINDGCVALGIPLVSAALFRFEGQLSVFNYMDSEGIKGPDYRDLFPVPPSSNLVPNCAETGVLGVIAGIIGSLQAAEVIKVITGIGEILNGKLLLFDALSMESRIINISKGISDKPASLEKTPPERTSPEISCRQYRKLLDAGRNIVLIDVRNLSEHEETNIGGIHMPLESIEERLGELPIEPSAGNHTVVLFYCQSGYRSAVAVQLVKEVSGATNVFSLRGGLNTWVRETELKTVV